MLGSTQLPGGGSSKPHWSQRSRGRPPLGRSAGSGERHSRQCSGGKGRGASERGASERGASERESVGGRPSLGCRAGDEESGETDGAVAGGTGGVPSQGDSLTLEISVATGDGEVLPTGMSAIRSRFGIGTLRAPGMSALQVAAPSSECFDEGSGMATVALTSAGWIGTGVTGEEEDEEETGDEVEPSLAGRLGAELDGLAAAEEEDEKEDPPSPRLRRAGEEGTGFEDPPSLGLRRAGEPGFLRGRRKT
jgi:hypothetical protein